MADSDVPVRRLETPDAERVVHPKEAQMKHSLRQIIYHYRKILKIIKREWALLREVVPWKDDDMPPTGCA